MWPPICLHHKKVTISTNFPHFGGFYNKVHPQNRFLYFKGANFQNIKKWCKSTLCASMRQMLCKKPHIKIFYRFREKWEKPEKALILEKSSGGQSFWRTTSGYGLSAVEHLNEHPHTQFLGFSCVSSKITKPPFENAKNIAKAEKVHFGPLSYGAAPWNFFVGCTSVRVKKDMSLKFLPSKTKNTKILK